MNERDERWNSFINDICFPVMAKGIESAISQEQKYAILCFWYDAEMNSGGFSGYLDCYPDTEVEDLEAAIRAVGNDAIAENYLKAVREGEDDDYLETDTAYYDFEPSLCDCLQEYVESNKDAIFGIGNAE